jgi:hypothetical protein
VDELRIDDLELFGDVGLARRCKHQFLERRIERRMAQQRAHRVDEGRVQRLWRAGAYAGDQAAQREALSGLPAVERIAVVLQKHKQVGVREVIDDRHRCREVAQQRGHGLGVDVDEGEEAARLLEQQHTLGRPGRSFVLEPQGERTAVARNQPERERDHERLLVVLAVRGCAVLLEPERVAARRCVVAAAGGDARRAGLRVPALELR